MKNTREANSETEIIYSRRSVTYIDNVIMVFYFVLGMCIKRSFSITVYKFS